MEIIIKMEALLKKYVEDSEKCFDCKLGNGYCSEHSKLIGGITNLLFQTREIEELIIKDIEYQKEKLTGDFEKDKPINWRITGMEYLLSKIEGLELNKRGKK